MYLLSEEYAASIGVNRPRGSLHSVGNRVCLDSIRNLILDHGSGGPDLVLLNQQDFDELVLEHRDRYGNGAPDPYILLEVRIAEDIARATPRNRVQLVVDGAALDDLNSEPGLGQSVVYRCGYCGDLVNDEGTALLGRERSKSIWAIERAHAPAIVHAVLGRCCRPLR